MKTNYITGYTGATEAEGSTPYICIQIAVGEPDIVEVTIRNRKGETQRIFVPRNEFKRMSDDITTYFSET